MAERNPCRGGRWDALPGNAGENGRDDRTGGKSHASDRPASTVAALSAALRPLERRGAVPSCAVSSAASPVLRLRGVVKRYGPITAVDGLDLLSLIHISEPTRRTP